MKPIRTTLAAALLVGVSSLFLHPSAVGQGALTPPGAPAPVFKTLDQTEPRTPISSIPINLTSPGSYYLTTNLTQTVSGGGIILGSHNITLDLNGFSLIGTNGPAVSIGVAAPSTRTNIVIRNGTVRNWNMGISLQGLSAGIIIDQVRVVDNSSNGVSFNTGTLVSRCVVHRNGGHGISIGGSDNLIRDCQITENGLDGVTMANNGSRIIGNYVRGLSVGPGPNAGLRAAGSQNHIADNTVTVCSTGITVAGGAANLVVRNFIHSCDTNLVGGTGNLIGPTNSATSSLVTNHPWANFTD